MLRTNSFGWACSCLREKAVFSFAAETSSPTVIYSCASIQMSVFCTLILRCLILRAQSLPHPGLHGCLTILLDFSGALSVLSLQTIGPVLCHRGLGRHLTWFEASACRYWSCLCAVSASATPDLTAAYWSHYFEVLNPVEFPAELPVSVSRFSDLAVGRIQRHQNCYQNHKPDYRSDRMVSFEAPVRDLDY